jgi:hypothetical protein
MSDPQLRQQTAEWLDAFGQNRRMAFGDTPATGPAALRLAPAGKPGACCSDG